MIRFENVTYTYPFQTRPAVSDISFSVRPGELVLCTGASGCGKSTLMRLANGLCPHYFQGAQEGRVLIGGEPTSARAINAIAREVGTLFQDPEQQFFALNVEDELAFAHEWQGISPEAIAAKIDEAARAFRLGPILSSSIHELSEGQKQKVGLASILSQGPKALILDEPSANLDPEATEDLARKLAELKARGMAILVVDHRLYWLEGVADRVLVMREGRIEEQGGFDMLYDDALRGRCGLRAARVGDPRRSLPDCAAEPVERPGQAGGKGGLAVSGLRFAYSGKPVLFDGVDVSVPAGVTALVGDNGTGKTTLARLLTGLNAAQAGQFAIGGQPVPASKLLLKVGIVLQNADHQLHMKTVRQELEVSLSLAGHGAGDVPGLLSLFALEGLAERHPQSLSGGEKQRLVIACAFAKRPDVLILDEPTSGLDGRNMRRIADALELLAGRGACVLVITHDLELMGLSCARALRLPLQPGRMESSYSKQENGV
ncbi:ABC transporter ATP-binding protein [uncultured Bilophila sp.]|uniref:ABC transporter ATP-binding protein n=1 Tax=uncultured Bilophila sp. TaxID=529385 RepID=UPI00280A90A7|nr:ABC transporter ATP-binding protein [uncultured Bilophila sp.]